MPDHDWQGRTRESADGLRATERKSAEQRLREGAERAERRAKENPIVIKREEEERRDRDGD